jgi:RNA polymerase sigma-70 factor (ECF subfamily)
MSRLSAEGDIPIGLPKRILDGDKAAESELFLFFQPRVYEFVMVRTGDAELAQDLGQEVLLAVIRSLREGRLRQQESLRSYVYGVARNLLQDQLRSRARQKLDQLPADFDLPQPPPEYEEKERETIAHQAIGELESTDRRILLMILVDGLKAGEIAARIGLSADGVRQRKSRALKRLGALLRPLSRNAAGERLNSSKSQ